MITHSATTLHVAFKYSHSQDAFANWSYRESAPIAGWTADLESWYYQIMKTHETPVLRPPADYSLASRVALQLEQLIFEGVLQLHQKLPSERVLCQKLGVSRTALREGLQGLRARGLLATTHGQGTFVARAAIEPIDHSPMQLFNAQSQGLYDLLEVRALLEGESARLAAIRGTDADFQLLSERYKDLCEAQEPDVQLDPMTHARLDHAFHLGISEASHNPILVHTLRSLTDLLLSSVIAAISNLYHRTPHKHLLDSQHARLYRAVISRQPEIAERAALDHIRGVIDSLREIDKDEQRLIRSTMRLNGLE